ncbi:MAG TPA: FAD-dependent oxidoreductase, partial [Anaerolineales bacterium]|nr:FAD-dependent oxidoreductase [Anaerolineales bacterium]
MTTPTFEKHFSSLENFGHSLRASSFVFKPKCEEEISSLFEIARKSGLTVTARGAGKSYNDASLNGGGIVLDLSQMNRITEWDLQTGRVTGEPGVTIQQLWQQTEPDGWWPPVVSGTMFTTLGGCLAANVHGK